eukprot:c18803_g1_i4.p1 GENE.c18803_g1_i4~~c18803_g1_i4.p1  ORF type:complete len:155 (+),score=19.11 c18803_g1_i4:35-466(+)
MDIRGRAQAEVDGYMSQFPDVPKISTSDLVSMISKAPDSVVLVDVRTDEERRVSIIPGALSEQEFMSRSPADFQDKTIVPYCTVGFRSGNYCRKLIQSGTYGNDIRNGEGILLWTHETQQPLHDVSQPDQVQLSLFASFLKSF